MIRAAALLLTLCLPLPAAGQDFVTSSGPLSDDDFYRLVACSASPGGACRDDLVRWAPSDASDLRVAIMDIKPGFPEEKVAPAQAALDDSIAQINAAGAALNLRLVAPEENPHITLHFWDQDEDDVITGMGLSGIDGGPLGAGYVYTWWDGNKHLTRGVIMLARDIALGDLPSIMLEELTQSTGLLTDIDNSWYDTRSIFAEHTNWVTALQAQDVMALRRHYPNE